MTKMSFRSSVNLLLVLRVTTLLLLPWSSVLFVAAQNNACTFSEPISIHQTGQVFLEEYINPDEGTFTMRIRFTGGSSWIGMGVNYDGESQMIPAYAVIGQIESSGLSSVQRYWIDAKDPSGLYPYEDINGHLKSSSFEQLDGESILTFTHDLVILDEENGSGNVEYEHNADSTWIWAVGSPNNLWGSHQLRGSFKLPLSENCVAPQDEPIATEEPVGTANPVVDGGDTGGAQQEDDPEASIVGNEIDREDGTDQQEETTDPTIDNNGSSPVVVETEGPANSPTTNSTSDSASGIVFSEENDLEGARSLWNAHGMCMGLAWGLFSPLAIGAAILRNAFSVLRDHANWLRVHFWLNVLVVLLTVVGFVLAVVATHKETGAVQYFSDTTHSKAGFSVLVLVLVHSWAAFFRPSLPKHSGRTKGGDGCSDGPVAKSLDSPRTDRRDEFAASKDVHPNQSTERDGDEENVDGNDGIDAGFEVPPEELRRTERPTSIEDNMDYGIESDGEETWSVDSPPPQQYYASSSTQNSLSSPGNQNKSMLRRAWEYLHRLLGMTLLGLAWYSCHSGIVLLTSKYYELDQDQLLTVFWTIAGGLAALIFVLAYVIRM